jgi:hypothetical protein
VFEESAKKNMGGKGIEWFSEMIMNHWQLFRWKKILKPKKRL